jgi:hypothetical protein
MLQNWTPFKDSCDWIVAVLKEKPQYQQLTFKKHNVESELGVKVSYNVSEKIATASKPFTDREFIKKCMESAAKI